MRWVLVSLSESSFRGRFHGDLGGQCLYVLGGLRFGLGNALLGQRGAPLDTISQLLARILANEFSVKLGLF